MLNLCGELINSQRICDDALTRVSDIAKTLIHIENALMHMISGNLTNGLVYVTTFKVKLDK